MADHTTGTFNIDGGIHQVPLPTGGGRLFLCGKHHVAPDPETAIRAVGADLVVCLVERSELADRYDHYVSWLGASEGTASQWWPIPDLSYPSDDEATLARLRTLAERLQRGDTIVVHCGAGVGRAGTTAVGILVLLGMGCDAALSHVRAHRPHAGPEAGPQREFVERLCASRHDRRMSPDERR